MSRIQPSIVRCPACRGSCSVRLFESLNADRIPLQVEAILDGSFERTSCTSCSAVFQPEHHMLFASYRARLWIVMYPLTARADHASLEAEVSGILQRNFAESPVVVADGLRGIRPRLVFGQYGLREALSSARDALDPPLLECAKLLAYRRNLSQLFALGPCELVYERSDGDGQLGFGVRALASGERLGELRIAGKILGETRERLPELEASHRELFERPYVSAVRYLLGAP